MGTGPVGAAEPPPVSLDHDGPALPRQVPQPALASAVHPARQRTAAGHAAVLAVELATMVGCRAWEERSRCSPRPSVSAFPNEQQGCRTRLGRPLRVGMPLTNSKLRVRSRCQRTRRTPPARIGNGSPCVQKGAPAGRASSPTASVGLADIASVGDRPRPATLGGQPAQPRSCWANPVGFSRKMLGGEALCVPNGPQSR